MNNLLLIIGMIALSNGNISLFDNKNKSDSNRGKSRKSDEKINNKKKGVSKKPNRKRNSNIKDLEEDSDDIMKFNANDINKGIKLMDLSEEDLDRGMDIISRTKKYMSSDEKKILIKVESVLDLVKGIKKLSNVEMMSVQDESNFFRSMDDVDKKNMMIKEILEVFPEKRKESVEKAIDIKKKIDLFAELFLPDDFGEGGFSLSSLANIGNLGSASNLKLLGSLLKGDDDHEDVEEDDDEYEYEYEYEYEDYEDFDDENDENDDSSGEYYYEYEYVEYNNFDDE